MRRFFWLVGVVLVLALGGRGEGAWAGEDLIEAAGYRDLATVRSLLNSGANVNQPDKSGKTSLSLAASQGHADVVKILLAHGAKPTNNVPSQKGQSESHLEPHYWNGHYFQIFSHP